MHAPYIMADEIQDKQKSGTITVFVNGQKYELDSEDVRVGDLIKLGGGTTAEYELQRRKGGKGPVEETFTDHDKVIKVKNDDRFTTRFTGVINPA